MAELFDHIGLHQVMQGNQNPLVEVRPGLPVGLRSGHLLWHLRQHTGDMVTPGRLELPAYGLGNRRSILLSYGVSSNISSGAFQLLHQL